MYMPNSVFSRAFCAYETYFMNFHTQLLRFSHTQQCDRAIKEEGRNVLFNDVLNTFYLQLYGIRHNGKGPLR